MHSTWEKLIVCSAAQRLINYVALTVWTLSTRGKKHRDIAESACISQLPLYAWDAPYIPIEAPRHNLLLILDSIHVIIALSSKSWTQTNDGFGFLTPRWVRLGGLFVQKSIAKTCKCCQSTQDSHTIQEYKTGGMERSNGEIYRRLVHHFMLSSYFHGINTY